MSTPAALGRGEVGYEQRRRELVWQQLLPRRYPASIVTAGDTPAVTAALELARRTGRRVSVVSGGHSHTGNGVQDDVVLVDLSAMSHVLVDDEAGTARIGPAATHADLLGALRPGGWAFPVGHSPTVGLGGYLLGGGLGWNPDTWGVGAGSVVGATVVLAGGEVTRVDAGHHPDLLWAVRGGGPLVPLVVLELELQLVPGPLAVVELRAEYPPTALAAVARWAGTASTSCQEPGGGDLDVSIVMSWVDGQETGPVVTAVAFADSTAVAEERLGTLRRTLPSDPPPQWHTRHCDLSDLVADGDAPARRMSVAGVWAGDAQAVMIACHDVLSSSASPSSLSPPSPSGDGGVDALVHLQLRRRPRLPPDAAFSVCDTTFAYSELTWDDAALDPAAAASHDLVLVALEPLASGYYVNETDLVRHPHLLSRCFGPDAMLRLRELRHRYDPDGLFAAPAGVTRP